MTVTVLAVGRVRGPLAEAVHEYENRAARYWKLETIEVAAGAPGGSGARPARVRSAEAERIRGKVPAGSRIVALTRKGSRMDSTELARYLEEAGTRSIPRVVFVIGGAYGLDRSILDDAERRVSLSAMTLPHEMARLVLAEQLYRAGTIVRGEPYHKGAE